MVNKIVRFNIALISAVILISFLGCSSSAPTDITIPVNEDRTSQLSHQLWGVYQFACNPETESIDVVPLRAADMHVNALVFLEPPAFVLLSLDYLEFDGNLITADIGLRHPFLGLTEFTGFDVCGVFITNGSVTGFVDSDLRMAGEGDTRLLNPDGHTRWWNPSEFPMDGTMFGYVDGLLGAPDSIANFNCTINGYKYYADGLDVEDDYTALDPANRGVFSAGQKNVRRFEIELGTDGLIFNYAIDANWEFPQGDPPWTAPEDFSPNANRVEAWGMDISEGDNTLFNDGSSSGGGLSLSINIYDHFNADMNTVRVESPGNFNIAESSTTTGGGVGYSTYEIDITDATPAENSIDLLITVECEESGYQGIIPGVSQASYFTYTAEVASGSPALPVTGNVLLETVRDSSKIITSLRISWTGNGAPEYAVYADTDPYSGFDDFTNLVGTTSANFLVFNSSNWTGYSTNAAYAFTVRARSQAGSAATESEDSEYCFCELDDFEGGTEAGGGTWINRSYNPAIQFQNSTGPWTVHGGGCFAAQEIRLGRTHGSPSAPVTHWICVISPELPDIMSNEESRFEFNIHYERVHDNDPYASYGNFGDVRVVGCCTTPPTTGSLTIDFDISGPDTDNWLEGFHYDWPTVPSFPPGDVIYNVYGAPSSYHTTLGKIYWYSPKVEYTRYAAWTFNESFETLEGYSDGRRYVGIGYARNYLSADDCYHDIAYDDFAVILY